MSGPDGSAKASIVELEARIASVPGALRRAAAVALPTARGAKRVVTTGIGGSEGPARMLASTLVEHAGLAARFVPLSAFALARQEGDLLVVFSQGLSPNARLALTSDHRFTERWIVTSVGAAGGAPDRRRESLVRRGIVPIVVPPEREDGMLVRVVGPAVASLVALRLAAVLGARSLATLPFGDAATIASELPAVAPLPPVPVALVTAGAPDAWAHGLRWKLLEALLEGDPPVWDVLQVAHGPLQTFHERPSCLVALVTPDASALVDPLERTLSPGRHRLVRVAATRTDALAFFELTAALDAIVLATLRARPRDLFDWPARGGDAPLYRFGE